MRCSQSVRVEHRVGAAPQQLGPVAEQDDRLDGRLAGERRGAHGAAGGALQARPRARRARERLGNHSQASPPSPAAGAVAEDRRHVGVARAVGARQPQGSTVAPAGSRQLERRLASRLRRDERAGEVLGEQVVRRGAGPQARVLALTGAVERVLVACDQHGIARQLPGLAQAFERDRRQLVPRPHDGHQRRRGARERLRRRPLDHFDRRARLALERRERPLRVSAVRGLHADGNRQPLRAGVAEQRRRGEAVDARRLQQTRLHALAEGLVAHRRPPGPATCRVLAQGGPERATHEAGHHQQDTTREQPEGPRACPVGLEQGRVIKRVRDAIQQRAGWANEDERDLAGRTLTPWPPRSSPLGEPTSAIRFVPSFRTQTSTGRLPSRSPNAGPAVERPAAAVSTRADASVRPERGSTALTRNGWRASGALTMKWTPSKAWLTWLTCWHPVRPGAIESTSSFGAASFVKATTPMSRSAALTRARPRRAIPPRRWRPRAYAK